MISHLKDIADQNCDMHDLMIDIFNASSYFEVYVDGLHKSLASSSKEIKAGHTNFDVFKSHGTSSWVTMATFLAITMRTFIVKEIFLLTSRYLKTWKLHQSSTKYMVTGMCLMCLMDM